jgi:hypothetical protein
VAACFVQLFTRQVRSPHAHIARGKLRLLRELFEFLDDGGAAREPERQAGADVVVEGEELEFFAELAVVALLRFLEHGEVGVELGAILEGGTVDALELRVLLVAFVVGAGDVRELERADVAGAHDVRAGAEIGEVAVAVEGDFFALGNVLDDVELELARRGARPEAAQFAGLRQCQRFAATNDNALEGVVRFRLLLHLGFDLREVFGRDAMRELDVVVEAVLDRRTRGELRLGPDLQDRGGEHVRGGMAKTLDIGHLCTLFGSLAVVAHGTAMLAVLCFFTSGSAKTSKLEKLAKRWNY